MITVEHLTKYYGDKLGVNDISFTIEKGEIVGLLGPNGAGKSTIMKMLTGYMAPTSGTIQIDGVDVVEDPAAAGKKIGFLPEIPPLYLEMGVEDYLLFMAEIRKVPRRQRKEHVAQVMEQTSITHVKDRLIRNLSKGYRQRVGLAQALIGFPEVLILDEPTVGLDPKQIAEVRGLIEKLSEDHTIILSSHILSEIKMTCERVIIINRGYLVAADTLENLEQGDACRFQLQVQGEAGRVRAVLGQAPGILLLEEGENQEKKEGESVWVVTTQPGQESRVEIFHRLAAADLPILELRPLRHTLEEAFLSITSREVLAGGAGEETPPAPPDAKAPDAESAPEEAVE